MHKFKIRYHNEPISQERRRPNLSPVEQSRMYNKKSEGDIMSNTMLYLMNLAPGGIFVCLVIGYILGRLVGQ